MLSVRQAAERIGVSAALVYGWVGAGLLAHYRLGGRGKRGKILVDEADVAAFLVTRRVAPRSQTQKPQAVQAASRFQFLPPS